MSDSKDSQEEKSFNLPEMKWKPGNIFRFFSEMFGPGFGIVCDDDKSVGISLENPLAGTEKIVSFKTPPPDAEPVQRIPDVPTEVLAMIHTASAIFSFDSDQYS